MVGACYLAYLFKKRAKHLEIETSRVKAEMEIIVSSLALSLSHIAKKNGIHVRSYEIGNKFIDNILSIVEKSGISKDPRIDHLVNTSPELFFKRFASREVEVTRITSNGEQTINGYLSNIRQSADNEIVFNVIHKDGCTVKDTDIKHSEIINFKFFDK